MADIEFSLPRSTLIYLVLALCAFAANSVLCRLALLNAAIDPVSFTTIRLCSGAIALFLIVRAGQQPSQQKPHPSRLASAAMLFGYAICFSLAYVTLSTGTGALILFTAVQITMLTYSIVNGERPSLTKVLGFALAMGGLIWLLFPGISAPSFRGASLMACAGGAWGAYSILGKSSKAPIVDTASNFGLASLPALVFSIVLFASQSARLDSLGVGLAITSGAITSGLGYVVWYSVLPKLASSQASIVQLTVPVIASVAGVLFLSESVTTRLVGSSALILVGVAVANRQPTSSRASTQRKQSEADQD